MKRKKVISLFLSLMMLISLMAGLDFNAYAGTWYNTQWSFNSTTGKLTITGEGSLYSYSNDSGSGSPFYGNKNIKILEIDNRITGIGHCDFLGCSEIEEIIMPITATYGCMEGYINGNTVYASGAFSSCHKIKKVTLTPGTGNKRDFTYTPYGSAYSIYNAGTTIAYTTKPDKSLMSIMFTPWYNSRNTLEEVVIGEGVTAIGNNTFLDCSNLKKISLPSSLTSISGSAFTNCRNIEEVIVDENNTTFDSRDNSNAIIETATNKLVVGTNKTTVPNTIGTIGANAFSGCVTLNEISLPDSVKTIDNNAFSDCSKLSNVLLGDGIEIIGDNAFNNCTSLTEISLPDSVKTIGKSAFNNCKNLDTVRIGSAVTTIPATAFSGCSKISTISIPASSKYDYSTIISNKDAFTNMIISAGTGKMVDWSLDYTNSLWYKNRDTIKEITLEEGVENISESAFNGCTNLIKTTIPFTVKNISNYAFYDCPNLKKITILSPNVKIADSKNTIPATATIYGYEDSTAQAYAEKYDISFISLGKYVCDIHDYDIEEILATCTQNGGTKYTCKVCDYSYIENTIQATGHTPVIDEELVPTCTERGLSQGMHCSVCNEVIVPQRQLSSAGHQMVSNVYASTCTERGYTEYICIVCGLTYNSNYVDSLGSHSYDTKVVEPTCEAKGFTIYTCSGCNDTFKSDYVDIVEHEYNSIVTKEATCTEKGSKKFTCVICGDTYSEAINAKGHTVVIDKAVAPTYTKTGKTEGSHCSVCKTVIKKQETVAKKTLAKPTSVKATAQSKGFKLTWKKVSAAKGYEIQYSTSSKFTSPKKITISSVSTVSKTVTKLTAKKKYYVRIRSYYKDSNGTAYSSWVSTSVTTKK